MSIANAALDPAALARCETQAVIESDLVAEREEPCDSIGEVGLVPRDKRPRTHAHSYET
jgi:hypothetical protein